MIVESTTIDRLRGSYASCFGCGLDNLHGLQLDGFERDGDRVTTVVEIPERFCGFEGVVHGGVVATTLDEISAWAAMLTEGVFVFTARLDISYRRKVPASERLELRAVVRERRSRRLAIEAELCADDVTLASSEGLFVVAGAIDDLID